MRISRIEPLQDLILRVETDDGVCGDFDIRPYLDYEFFEPLRDPAEFRKVKNGGYYVEWECGADLSVDTIEAHFKKLT